MKRFDIDAVKFLAAGQDDMQSVVLMDCLAEIERLTKALHQANSQAEHFERLYYLAIDSESK